jgi:hypothetical protein
MKVQFILNDIIYTMNLSEWVKTIAQLKNSIINDKNDYTFSKLQLTFEENDIIYEPYDTDLIENIQYNVIIMS